MFWNPRLAGSIGSFLIVVGLIFAPARLPAAEDIFDAPARVVAVGDIHGDYPALEKVLRAAALVDVRGHWVGGAAHLVLVGDLPDRGPDTRRVAEWLMELEKQSAKAGGRVHVLIGNHDAMMIYGDLRYTLPAEFAAFADGKSEERRRRYLEARREAGQPESAATVPLGWVEHRQAWSREGRLGRWTLGHNAVIRIGRTLFVHAGISPRVAALSVAEINKQIREELLGKRELNGGLTTAEDGPLWYRGLATEPEASIGGHVETLLRTYGADRIVIGHTPTRQPVAGRLGGRVINVDVGLSQAYRGPSDCLVIEGSVLSTLLEGVRKPLTQTP